MPDNDQFDQPLRVFRPQRMAAFVAGLGTAVIQLGWLEVAKTKNTQSWPADGCLLVAVSIYLICLAWFHASTAMWRPDMLVQRLWRLGEGLVYDLSIGALTIVALVRGPQSGVLLLGQSLVPPTLLAACAISALVSMLACRDGYDRFFVDVPPPGAPFAKPRHDWMRLICWLLLLLVLWAVEFGEPELRGANSPHFEASPRRIEGGAGLTFR
jgi:hypothetical protein